MRSASPRPRLILALCVLLLVVGTVGHGAEPPEALYQEAQERLWQGRHAESARIFRRLLQQHPDHDLRLDAAFGLGRALFREGEHGAARKHFRTVAEQHGDTLIRAEATLDLARVDLKQGHDTRARRRLDRFLERYPDHVLSHRVRRIRTRLAARSPGEDFGDTGVPPPLRTAGDTAPGRTIRLSPGLDTGSADPPASSAEDTPAGTDPGGADGGS